MERAEGSGSREEKSKWGMYITYGMQCVGVWEEKEEE